MASIILHPFFSTSVCVFVPESKDKVWWPQTKIFMRTCSKLDFGSNSLVFWGYFIVIFHCYFVGYFWYFFQPHNPVRGPLSPHLLFLGVFYSWTIASLCEYHTQHSLLHYFPDATIVYAIVWDGKQGTREWEM